MEYDHKNCADPSVGVLDSAPEETKRLWTVHGHPHSQRYINPDLRSLTALIEYNATTFPKATAFIYPASQDIDSYRTIPWAKFHKFTTLLARIYGQSLRTEILEAKRIRKQPTVALLGRGTTFEYFATQIALLKLNLRVLLLADGNPAPIIQGLLLKCHAVTVLVDTKHVKFDSNGVRKILMLKRNLDSEDYLEKTADVELETLRFEDGADPWERHTFTLHSSGSTGPPKAITHTNRSLMLGTRIYRLFSRFHIDNWFLLFPLYHIAGIYVILGGLPNAQITSFCTQDWPPTASSIISAWKTLESKGHPVDCAHSPPTIIETLHEYLIKNGHDFSPLSCLKILQPGGAKLSDNIVSSLVSHGVNVKSTYGSTEIGAVMRTIPHTKDNPHCYEGFRNIFPDSDKLEMLDVGNNLYELIIHKGFELAAELWLDKADVEPYRTNDLFLQDPPNSGNFSLIGRRDDLLILSDGNNVSAGNLQLDIQAGNPVIKNVLAVGHTRPCVSLLIEVKESEDQANNECLESIWKGIEKVNQDSPRHWHVLRSMVYVLPKGESLPVTPKGNVKRNETLKIFSGVIEELYRSLKGENKAHITQNKEVQLSQISDIVSLVSGIPSTELKYSTNFYEIGMDSIAALQLRSLLSEKFGSISLGAIFENPSVEKLAEYFKPAKTPLEGNESLQFIKQIVDKYSYEFSSWPSSTSQIDSGQAGEIILLTGASGSLGTALIERLNDSPGVNKIYAFLRGSDSEKALRESLDRHGLQADILLGKGKIAVLNYNMTDPLLGLDIDTYYKLAKNVTVIVHNAWRVDFNQAVQSFERDCLRGTMSLLRFCHAGRPKLFTYTSSISASLGTAADQEVHESPIGSDPNVALTSGYAQSKYIIERITQIASVQLKIRCKIFRIGQLSGHSNLGYWSENDMYPIMFVTSKNLDAIPKFTDRAVDWLPVDLAAGVITDILVQDSTQEKGEDYTVHHIVNPNPIPWCKLLSMIQGTIGSTTGQQLEQTSIQEWIKRLTNKSYTDPTNAKRFPALRLLTFFEAMASEKEEFRTFDTKKTEELSRTLQTSPPFNKDWMERYIKGWEQSGFWN